MSARWLPTPMRASGPAPDCANDIDDMNDIHLLRVGVSHPCHHGAMDDMSDMSFALGRACESCHHPRRRPVTRGGASRGYPPQMMA